MNRNCGIKIESTSDYNFVNDNVIEQNENHGIVLYSSSYNNIYNNNMTLNAASGVILYMYSNCNLIAHNTAKLNFKGVELGAFSGNNNVSENNLVDNNYGVILDTSQNNTIFANNLICSKYYGVYLYSSPNNTIINNKIRNGFTGIFLYMSSQNLLSNNLLTNNTYNLEVDGKNISHFINQIDTSNVIEEKPVYYLINKQNFTVPLDAGYIAMVNCSEITVRDQSLSHNAEGVLLAYTTNTTIVANNITNNRCGIHLHSSSNNLIYHNNFVNNIRNVYTFNSINVFDNGFEGNYWSTCSVQDSNKDGIGDIPYIIDDDSKDNFPLMGTFYSYSIAERVYVEIISNLTIKKIELIEANSTIKISTLEASTDQAQGFCRLTIPHAVISPPYNIVINDSPMASKLVFENENLSIIYCSYPDQIIQEFHVFVILLLFITLTLITLIFHKIRFCGH
jgi:parallel beta-helix repeat protein